MVATQGLLGDRRDVVATEIERAQVLAVEHPVRPFGQIIVAQIQRLQLLENTDIKGIQCVVAQVQPAQTLQTVQ
ncbi:hypothetical protein D3C78_446080 [compost metagenome]